MPKTMIIDRDFQDAIALACKVTARKDTIPILETVLIEATGANGFRVTATDLDVWMTITGPSDKASNGFAAALPAHDLAARLKGIDAETATLSDDGKVEADGTSVSFETRAVEDFPRGEPSFRADVTFDLTVEELRRALAAVTFAISTEETRYYLNGIYMHASGEKRKLRFVATDGHRLARYDLKGRAGVGRDMPGVIIPRMTAVLLPLILKSHDADETVKVEIGYTLNSEGVPTTGRKLRFTVGNVEIVSKDINGTFPNYTRVIPAGNTKVLSLKADDFAKAIDAVYPKATRDIPHAVKLTVGGIGSGPVKVSWKPAGEAPAAETKAKASEDTGFEPGYTIGFSGDYLRHFCRLLKGQTITLTLEDPGSPALITSDDKAWLGVLMPMRVR